MSLQKKQKPSNFHYLGEDTTTAHNALPGKPRNRLITNLKVKRVIALITAVSMGATFLPSVFTPKIYAEEISDTDTFTPISGTEVTPSYTAKGLGDWIAAPRVALKEMPAQPFSTRFRLPLYASADSTFEDLQYHLFRDEDVKAMNLHIPYFMFPEYQFDQDNNSPGRGSVSYGTIKYSSLPQLDTSTNHNTYAHAYEVKSKKDSTPDQINDLIKQGLLPFKSVKGSNLEITKLQARDSVDDNTRYSDLIHKSFIEEDQSPQLGTYVTALFNAQPGDSEATQSVLNLLNSPTVTQEQVNALKDNPIIKLYTNQYPTGTVSVKEHTISGKDYVSKDIPITSYIFDEHPNSTICSDGYGNIYYYYKKSDVKTYVPYTSHGIRPWYDKSYFHEVLDPLILIFNPNQSDLIFDDNITEREKYLLNTYKPQDILKLYNPETQTFEAKVILKDLSDLYTTYNKLLGIQYPTKAGSVPLLQNCYNILKYYSQLNSKPISSAGLYYNPYSQTITCSLSGTDYRVECPNGESHQLSNSKGFTYSIHKSGIYRFTFTDQNGYQITKSVIATVGETAGAKISTSYSTAPVKDQLPVDIFITSNTPVLYTKVTNSKGELVAELTDNPANGQIILTENGTYTITSVISNNTEDTTITKEIVIDNIHKQDTVKKDIKETYNTNSDTDCIESVDLNFDFSPTPSEENRYTVKAFLPDGTQKDITDFSNPYHITENGNYTFTIVDPFGTFSTVTKTITQIQSKPTIEVTVTENEEEGTATAKVKATNADGINKITLGDQIFTPEESTKEIEHDFTITTTGKYTATVYSSNSVSTGSTEGAGDEEGSAPKAKTPTASKDFEVVLENAPVINYELSDDHKAAITIDSKFGIKSITYPDGKVDTYSEEDELFKPGIHKLDTIDLPTGGVYTITVTDRNNNSATKSFKFTANKTDQAKLSCDSTDWSADKVTLKYSGSTDTGFKSVILTDPTGTQLVYLKNPEELTTGFSGEVEVDLNGTYTLTVKDNNNQFYEDTYNVNTIDKEKPELEVTTTDDINSWATQFTYNINAEDKGSGIASVTCNDEPVSNKVTFTENGTYTIKVTDRTGHVTESDPIVIDHIDSIPELTLTQEEDKADPTIVHVKAAYKNAGSNLKEILLPDETTTTLSDTEGVITFDVNQDGAYKFKVTNETGLFTEKTAYVTIGSVPATPTKDTEKPVIKVTSKNDSSKPTKDKVTLHVEVSDNSNQFIFILPDGSHYTEETYPEGGIDFEVTNNGSYLFKAVDYSGNTTEHTEEVNFIDNVKPAFSSVTRSGENGITCTISKTPSGLKEVKYTVYRVNQDGETSKVGDQTLDSEELKRFLDEVNGTYACSFEVKNLEDFGYYKIALTATSNTGITSDEAYTYIGKIVTYEDFTNYLSSNNINTDAITVQNLLTQLPELITFSDTVTRALNSLPKTLEVTSQICQYASSRNQQLLSAIQEFITSAKDDSDFPNIIQGIKTLKQKYKDFPAIAGSLANTDATISNMQGVSTLLTTTPTKGNAGELLAKISSYKVTFPNFDFTKIEKQCQDLIYSGTDAAIQEQINTIIKTMPEKVTNKNIEDTLNKIKSLTDTTTNPEAAYTAAKGIVNQKATDSLLKEYKEILSKGSTQQEYKDYYTKVNDITSKQDISKDTIYSEVASKLAEAIQKNIDKVSDTQTGKAYLDTAEVLAESANTSTVTKQMEQVANTIASKIKDSVKDKTIPDKLDALETIENSTIISSDTKTATEKDITVDIAKEVNKTVQEGHQVPPEVKDNSTYSQVIDKVTKDPTTPQEDKKTLEEVSKVISNPTPSPSPEPSPSPLPSPEPSPSPLPSPEPSPSPLPSPEPTQPIETSKPTKPSKPDNTQDTGNTQNPTESPATPATPAETPKQDEKENTYTVSITVEHNGFSEIHNKVVSAASPFTYTQKVNSGEKIDKVFINNKEVSATKEISIPSVTCDTDIYISIIPEKITSTTHKVTISTIGHGDVDSSSTLYVEDGDSVTIEATPEPGYKLDCIFMNNSYFNATGNKLKIKNIHSSMSLEFYFTPIENASNSQAKEETFTRTLLYQVNSDLVNIDGNNYKQVSTVSASTNKMPYIPLDSLLKALGQSEQDFSWNPITKTLLIDSNSTIYKFELGKQIYYKDGETCELKNPIGLINSHVCVPIDLLPTLFRNQGCKVYWNTDNQTIKVIVSTSNEVRTDNYTKFI